MRPHLRALVTATPPHEVSQAEALELAAQLYPELAAVPRLAKVFPNSGIRRRYLARPPEWLAQGHDFATRNAAWIETAEQLGREVITAALSAAALSPGDLDALVFVTTTGLRTPSLDARWIDSLGLPRHVTRLPVWGLGCAGGAAGLGRAADLVRAGKRHVLLVVIECCSLTFVREDARRSNFTATALFGDGAAAAVLSAEGPGPLVRGSASHLLADSDDIMGWDLAPEGLRVRFARDIPNLVSRHVPDSLAAACVALGTTVEEVAHHVVHPGGPKVLAAYEGVLGMPEGALNAAREVLAEYGNMSAPTVLFVLERMLRQGMTPGLAALTAMGPGFSIDHVLLEVPGP
ncbi:MAG: chalcone synthase [Candidatus Sericytochromatia bacterium]|nr:chalcone synthase [Candidatus Sericytochromatia bacterium]